MDTIDLSNSPTAAETNKRAGRGTSLSTIEKICLRRAYGNVTENPLVGANQSCKEFKIALKNKFDELIDEQLRKDRISYAHCSAETLALLPPGHSFPSRTPDVLYRHFKDKMAAPSAKLFGIVETMPRASGANDDDHFQSCVALYDLRYPNQKFDTFKDAYEYLVKCPKFTVFRQMINEQEKASTASAMQEKESRRPLSGRDVKKQMAERIIMEKVRQEFNIPADGATVATAVSLDGNGLLGTLCAGALSFMNDFMDNKKREREAKEEQEILLGVTTPQRKRYQQMKFEALMQRNFGGSATNDDGNNVPSEIHRSGESTISELL
ncbi:hypothetical protein MPSEU_000600000 [Mayamaea pseudoterrestris]|nr:hypothetical protein MPSEU_000600000 [Mayamaea pseudoterrestris]